MDASVQEDSRVFMQNRGPGKYLADSRVKKVVKPDGLQCTLKHGRMLIEEILAGIEPLKFRRKVENKMRFDLVTYEPDALFNITAKQERVQAEVDAIDAVRRQTGKRRDARSPPAAGTKPQRRTENDERDSRERAKAAGVKAE